jgi:hypothetical protein
MPVILENGSKDIATWLDRKQTAWTKELQSMLQPYKDELEIYPVPKDVGKVGNNSPTFIQPLDSIDNKSNIKNMFGQQQAKNNGFTVSNSMVKSSATSATSSKHPKPESEESSSEPPMKKTKVKIEPILETSHKDHSSKSKQTGIKSLTKSPTKSPTTKPTTRSSIKSTDSKKITSFFSQ